MLRMDKETVELIAEVRSDVNRAKIFNRVMQSAQKIDFDTLNPQQITDVLDLGLKAAWDHLHKSKGITPQTSPTCFVADDTRETIRDRIEEVKNRSILHFDARMKIAAIAVKGFIRDHDGAVA